MARFQAPRPPSVETLLSAVRPRLSGDREQPALVAAAQELIADERGRIAGGASARGLEALADELVATLERLAARSSSRAGNWWKSAAASACQT